MCLLTACLPVCRASVQYRACTRAYTHGHAHIAHVRTCAHVAHAPARVCTCRTCLPVPACRPSEAMLVCYGHVLYCFPTVLACLCWSLLYAHVCTHVCTGNARTHGTHAMVAHVCTHVRTSCLHTRKPTRTRPSRALAQNQGRVFQNTTPSKH